MFRQGMRRCAQRAVCAPGASALLRPTFARSAVQATRSSRLALQFPRIALSYSTAHGLEEDQHLEQVHVDGEHLHAEGTSAQTDGEITKFAELTKLGIHPNLLTAITNDMGYTQMTPVQAKTIVPALGGSDIVAQAKTGTGKTLAFLLPLLQRMLKEDPSLASRSAAYTARSDDIRGIIMSPTRELAEQIAAEARKLVRRTGLIVQSAVGGSNKQRMLQDVQRRGCHLLVATPGRLNDLLSDPRAGIAAPNLASIVLDEADRMLDVGFERELNQIIDRLPSAFEKQRQTVLVSATIPDSVIRLARNMVRADDFQFIQTIPENESLTHDHVPQHIVPVSSWANMFPALFELIEKEMEASLRDGGEPFKAIVYFNTTSLVELVGEMAYVMRTERSIRIPTFSIQSKLSQMQRQRAADSFRRAKTGVLFSSDVTARGMDFPNVTHVIQVDVPRERETYIHRLGRTGRQQKNGQGWLFVPPLSVHQARQNLRGLRLQKNDTLEAATADLNNGEMTRFHQSQIDTMTKVPRHLVSSAYMSSFGVAQGSDKLSLATDLNDMCIKGFGWTDPPAVSPGWAGKMGLPTRVMNISHDRYGGDDGGRGGGFDDRRYGGRGGRDGGRGGYGGRSRDFNDNFGGARRY